MRAVNDGKGKDRADVINSRTFANSSGRNWENAIVVDSPASRSADLGLIDGDGKEKASLFPSYRNGKRKRRGEGFSPQCVKLVKEEAEPSKRRAAKPVIDIKEEARCAFTCPICMEPKSLSDSFCMGGCSHLFCSECVGKYVTVKVEENATVVSCPSPCCKDGFLEPATCARFLLPETFERWCDHLCESMFIGPTRFYCPFKDCSALLMDDTHSGSSGVVIRECECPHCWRLFCAQCKVPWHADISCDEFQRLDGDERGGDDIKLMKLANEKKWQRCAMCKFFVERVHGCKFMKCRCGYTFCYTCGTKMTEDHYCNFCKA